MSKLRELIKAATPGPWVVRKARGDCFVQGNKVAGKTVAGEYFTEILSDESYAEKEVDCEFIAHMRNNADAIADLIDAAKAHIAILDADSKAYGIRMYSKTSDQLRAAIAKVESDK